MQSTPTTKEDSIEVATSVLPSPPTLRYMAGSVVVPGDRIGSIRQVRSGPGTYVKGNGHIYVSLVGKLRITPTKDSNSVGDGQQQPATSNDDENNNNNQDLLPQYTCSVEMVPRTSHSISNEQTLPASALVLQIGQIVLGVVTRITTQMALVDIRVAQHVGVLTTKTSSYHGAIRREDIRANATDQILLSDCFQPNDVVACRIVSVGDSRRYFLSTAETELGVLRATTRTTSRRKGGIPMIPISWKEMECPETGIKEPRKCAKPIALHQR